LFVYVDDRAPTVFVPILWFGDRRSPAVDPIGIFRGEIDATGTHRCTIIGVPEGSVGCKPYAHLKKAGPGHAHPDSFLDIACKNGVAHMLGGHFGLDSVLSFTCWKTRGNFRFKHYLVTFKSLQALERD